MTCRSGAAQRRMNTHPVDGGQVQVTAYVSEKNLRREPTGVALLMLKYVSRVVFVTAPHGVVVLNHRVDREGRLYPGIGSRAS